jgi:hypothetical protein
MIPILKNLVQQGSVIDKENHNFKKIDSHIEEMFHKLYKRIEKLEKRIDQVGNLSAETTHAGPVLKEQKKGGEQMACIASFIYDNEKKINHNWNKNLSKKHFKFKVKNKEKNKKTQDNSPKEAHLYRNWKLPRT